MTASEQGNMDMATISPAIEAECVPETSVRPKLLARPSLAGMRDTFLKRVRELAWRILDLETEFEAVD